MTVSFRSCWLPIALTLLTGDAVAQLGDARVLFLNPPPLVLAGSTFVLDSYDVWNDGPGPFYAFLPNVWRDRVYLSTTPSTAGVVWQSPSSLIEHYGQINVNQTYHGLGIDQPINVPVPASLASGTYYLGYWVDYQNLIPETSNGNNQLWVPIQVDHRPDYVITNLAASPDPVAAGAPLSISFTMTNQGGGFGAAPVRAGAFFSATLTIPPAEADRFGTSTTVSIGPGGSATFSGAPSVPIVPNGDYWLIVRADDLNGVTESDETNNYSYLPIRVGTAAAAVPFGSGCVGSSGTPVLGAIGAPQIGNAGFAYQADDLGPFTICILVEGLSDQSWGGLPLPLVIPGTGTPGCELLVSVDVATAQLATNSATFAKPIPNDISLIGITLFGQVWITDPINPFGLVASNGLRVTVGW